MIILLMNVPVKIFLCLLVALFSLKAPAQVQPDANLRFPADYPDFRNDVAFQATIEFSHIDFERICAVIFYLTNEIRLKHKLPLLKYHTELANAAKMHAQDMVEHDFFSHINPDDAGKATPNDRANRCGITNPFLAENIIEGYGLQYTSFETVYLRGKAKFSHTPDGELIKAHTYISFGEAQLKGWMNSKEHRKNILSTEALQLGCGAAFFINPAFNDMPTFYLVQNFQWYQPVATNSQ